MVMLLALPNLVSAQFPGIDVSYSVVHTSVTDDNTGQNYLANDDDENSLVLELTTSVELDMLDLI
jgi:hypothetical protein